ncbi:hypothetical protein HDE_07922 [Halotydeus destructor]|nr:hypothetical protein HDE_07922 [Halotydeus destructor]
MIKLLVLLIATNCATDCAGDSDADALLEYCGDNCFQSCNTISLILYGFLTQMQNHCHRTNVSISAIKKQRLFEDKVFVDIVDPALADMCPSEETPPEVKGQLEEYVDNCVHNNSNLAERENLCSDSDQTLAILNTCRREQFESRPRLFSYEGLFSHWLKLCCHQIEVYLQDHAQHISNKIEQYFKDLGMEEKQHATMF